MPKLRYRYILIKYDLPFSSLGQCQMYVFPNWHVDGLTMMIWVTRHILTCRQNSLPSCMCWVISNNLWVSTSRIPGCLVFTRTANSPKKPSIYEHVYKTTWKYTWLHECIKSQVPMIIYSLTIIYERLSLSYKHK